MAEFNDYPPGMPCWVECASSDAEVGRAFYSQLFGWEPVIGGAETAYYTQFFLKGRPVAALYEIGPDMKAMGVHPQWATYLATSDVRATADKIKPAGGQIIVEPMDVMDQGAMCVAADPTGATISFWEPRAHKGAGLANESGTFVWNELRTRDLDAAAEFYSAVAGWTVVDYDTGGGPRYLLGQVGDNGCAGLMDMAEMGLPDDVPPHWLTYFAVEDCDAAVDRAESLGATVTGPAMDTGQGRMAWLADPHGAQFAVGAMAPS